MKIGLIGCGNIGRFLLQTLNMDRVLPDCRIEAVYDARTNRLKHEAETYGVSSFNDFIAFIQSGIDLVIEAANIQVVQEYAPDIVKNGKDLLIVSVGALADVAFYDRLVQLCKTHGSKIYLPSGAIGGLDVVKAAMALGELDSVSITTRKPPQALGKEPIADELVLFEGSAEEAIKMFPQNINVSIILSLAGIGGEKTRVTIIADPKVRRNNHFIEAAGSFGKITVNLENNPMPNNPKTSYLAALSVLATLKNQNEVTRIG
ncbi:aspartate dehydrogenase [Effusibacillus pohliae]|uniref:aspartate dehydrogenase n=1 Tax=Effusibacillus pohliae TaxID=232270 RepID=UPI00035E0CF6|nr:aspartate dehydrogenase [Effusibacillus pohliae]